MRNFLLVAWTAALFATAGPAHAVRIVAATNDLGAIARAVTGPGADIDVVARSDRDPHTFEVTPGVMRLTAKADFYLQAGLSLDLWSADVIRGSRNKDLVVIDCATAIQPIEVPVGRVDASQGDVHPEGNPHYWLDPLNGAKVARLLADQFGRADHAHATDYHARAEAFAAEIEKRLPAWKSALEGRSFVEYHRTWAYLAARFGVEIAGRVEPLPGIPPSAKHLAELAGTIRSRKVTILIRDVYHAPSPTEFLERETGIRTVVLGSSCDQPTPEAYLALFDRVAEALRGPGGRTPSTG
jgi:zinc/manganese transport system substrate-binding protein